MSVQTLPTLFSFERVSQFKDQEMTDFLEDRAMGERAAGNEDLAKQFEFLRERKERLSRDELVAVALYLCGDRSRNVLGRLAFVTILRAVVISWESERKSRKMGTRIRSQYDLLAEWNELGFERIPLAVLSESQDFERDCAKLFDLG